MVERTLQMGRGFDVRREDLEREQPALEANL